MGREPRISPQWSISRFTILLISLCLCGFSAQAKDILTVAVASSLYPAMQQQVASFEKEHDVQVRLISGSTGRLYNQIIQGAPFDLFIAADEIRPARLVEQSKVIAEGKVGQGYLGVKSGGLILPELKLLNASSIQRIAIPNPDVAPFGQAARAALEELGLWNTLKAKLVYTQNAMQASMMVEQGLVNAGFVPLVSSEHAIAVIHYQGVVLTDKRLALYLLKYVAAQDDMPATLASAH